MNVKDFLSSSPLCCFNIFSSCVINSSCLMSCLLSLHPLTSIFLYISSDLIHCPPPLCVMTCSGWQIFLLGWYGNLKKKNCAFLKIFVNKNCSYIIPCPKKIWYSLGLPLLVDQSELFLQFLPCHIFISTFQHPHVNSHSFLSLHFHLDISKFTKITSLTLHFSKITFLSPCISLK